MAEGPPGHLDGILTLEMSFCSLVTDAGLAHLGGCTQASACW